MCKNNKVALVLAKQQEFIGRRMQSTDIVFKSLVYQGLNYYLMNKQNKAKKIFINCENFAKSRNNQNLLNFVNASKLWLISKRSRDLNNEITDVNYIDLSVNNDVNISNNEIIKEL